MFKKLRLKYGILLGYSIPLTLSILVAIVVYASILKVERQEALVDIANESLIQMHDLQYNMAKMQKAARGYLIVKNETSLKNFEEAEKNYKELFKALSKLATDTKEQDIFRRGDEIFKQLSEFDRGLILLVNEGKPDKALEQFRTGEPLKLSRELETLYDSFDTVVLESKQNRKNESLKASSILHMAIIGGTLLSIILAIGLGLWIASLISRNISDAVNAMSSTSTEIASTVEQHERTASQQAASVSETTTTIDELGASSRTSAEQADAVAAMAKQALTTTDEGVKMARQASDGMVKMKEKVEGIGVQILHLSEQTGQIGKIATMVTDIAGQINMLALNAAVEAVRAGEQGKGFAVIAQEVRKLADQGKKSAEQANTIVSDIQKATNSAVMVTEEGTKTVLDVAGIAQKAGEAFASLSGVATNVYENAQQVSLNSRQQGTAIKQVTDAMNSINAGAKETAAGISQTKIGIQRLNEAAQGLKKIV